MENSCQFFLWIIFQMFIFLALFFLSFSRESRKKVRELQAKIDNQESRTDRLYEMFVDLLKEGKHGK